MKRDGTSLKAKLANHHVKGGMAGHLFVSVLRIIAHSYLKVKSIIWNWLLLLNQLIIKNYCKKNSCNNFLGMDQPYLNFFVKKKSGGFPPDC
jgi:hypothetical protein